MEGYPAIKSQVNQKARAQKGVPNMFKDERKLLPGMSTVVWFLFYVYIKMMISLRDDVQPFGSGHPSSFQRPSSSV
jgi:hypothetical protein